MLKQKRGRNRVGRTDRSRAIDQMEWRIPVNRDRPTEPLDREGIEAIHNGALRVLKEIGIRFLNDEALQIFRSAGCIVKDDIVHMDDDFVMEMVGRAPSKFTITPRNRERALHIGGDKILFGNVGGAPNYFDLERGKVPGFMDGFRDLMKLSQFFNCIHFDSGYVVEPQDIHARDRHLDCLYEKLTLSDKVCFAFSLGKERVEDAMEMVRIAGALDTQAFREKPRMFTNINSVSPLKHDFPMIDGALRMARAGQMVAVTPFTLAGAMAPVTMAGAVTLSIAEALSAIALLQFVAPGSPTMIGTFTSNVDMKSGAPAFGTPEYMRATQMTGQLARHYGLALRSSGVCTANVPDGQAMWETSNSLWAAVQSGSHIVYHAAGWLEGGLIASPEKFVMDCELLQMIQRYMEPSVCTTTPQDIAFDAIAEVGFDGHFFGTQHTLDRYENAFYAPIASDWRNFEAWEKDGGTWSAERAHKIFREIIAEFEAPPMDDAIRDELRDFVARRKREGGAPTDY